jgi:hypothetical protein
MQILHYDNYIPTESVLPLKVNDLVYDKNMQRFGVFIPSYIVKGFFYGLFNHKKQKGRCI